MFGGVLPHLLRIMKQLGKICFFAQMLIVTNALQNGLGEYLYILSSSLIDEKEM